MSTSTFNFAAIRVHSNQSTTEIEESMTQSLVDSGASEEMVADFKQSFPNRKILTYSDQGDLYTSDRTEVYLPRPVVDHLTHICPPREFEVDEAGEKTWYYPEAHNEYFEKYGLSLYEITPPVWTRFQDKKEFTRENDEGQKVTETKEFSSETMVVHLPSGDSDLVALHRSTIKTVIAKLVPTVLASLQMGRGDLKVEMPGQRPDGTHYNYLIKLVFNPRVSLEMREFIYWIFSGRALLVTKPLPGDEPYLIKYSVMWAYKPRPRPVIATTRTIRR